MTRSLERPAKVKATAVTESNRVACSAYFKCACVESTPIRILLVLVNQEAGVGGWSDCSASVQDKAVSAESNAGPESIAKHASNINIVSSSYQALLEISWS